VHYIFQGLGSMRIVKNPQMQFGEVDISEIKFNPKSRDDIPKILKGLQFIYTNESVRKEIFNILENKITPNINKSNGRPGMELWKIFVMGVLRLDLNCDFDRLHHVVNYDGLIRKMLGHGSLDEEHHYEMQTIKDNVSLLTPELLDEVNQVIVKAGHILLKKKENDPLHGRCDSFVVETNVHFPTDINLLFDAMRKLITLTGELCDRHQLSDWRQYRYNVRQVKRLMRAAQNKKRASAKTEEQKKKRDKLIAEAHQEYIDVSQKYLDKACHTIKTLETQGLSAIKDVLQIENIQGLIKHALRQIDQIKRRVICGEMIPHAEKVFSIFQSHTEWVMKGKAGVPVELGVKICVMEDQHQFILHHMVMEKQTDDQIAVPMVDETNKRFLNLSTCSFDKGFHSPNNQKELSGKLDVVALKRKGRLSQQAREIEQSEEFMKARHKHSAVESAINALEVHGLDMCPDHGIHGFKRYVALAIAAHNIRRIGIILKNREQEIEKRKKEKYFIRNGTLKIAA
jgi:IS5 family transposase